MRQLSNEIQWYNDTEAKKSMSIDFIICMNHQYTNIIISNMKEKVSVTEGEIFCTLLIRQRSSNQIYELSYFLDRHITGRSYFKATPITPNICSTRSFDGPSPILIEVPNDQTFVGYAEQYFSNEKDGMIIAYDKSYKSEEISTLCSKLG